MRDGERENLMRVMQRETLPTAWAVAQFAGGRLFWRHASVGKAPPVLFDATIYPGPWASCLARRADHAGENSDDRCTRRWGAGQWSPYSISTMRLRISPSGPLIGSMSIGQHDTTMTTDISAWNLT